MMAALWVANWAVVMADPKALLMVVMLVAKTAEQSVVLKAVQKVLWMVVKSEVLRVEWRVSTTVGHLVASMAAVMAVSKADTWVDCLVG